VPQPIRVERESSSKSAHPDRALLQRFMRCETSPAELRAVVRHLLTQCPRCVQITRELWAIGGTRPTALDFLLLDKTKGRQPKLPSQRTGKAAAIAVIESVAQEQLLEIVLDLEGARDRLELLAAALPPAPADLDPEEDDVIVELRAVIDSVLRESIRPAIDDLLSAAFFPEKPPGEGGEGEKV
jgi:hypothetical protein